MRMNRLAKTGQLLLLVATLLCPMLALAAAPSIELKAIGTYATGIFDDAAAEIVAHDPKTQRLFIVNGSAAGIDVVDIADPAQPRLLFSISVTPFGATPNSVAVHHGVIAIAVEAEIKTDPGTVAFFDAGGNLLSQVKVGAVPDMLTFTPNGRKVLVANEGEPNDDYTIDPEGSVSIIDLKGGAANVTQNDVVTPSFTAFNSANLDPSIRIFGPGASVAQDLEPEFITVSANSKTASVVLQENNALGILDIKKGQFKKLTGLGFKNHARAKNPFDASDKDNAINIANWPVLGMYQPDGIDSFRHRGRTYLIMANEGDARDYDGFSEEARVKDLKLDPVAFPNAANLQKDEQLGRLNVTTANGDPDKDGDFEQLYAFGARSFSIRDADGKLIFDSGDDFERITAQFFPDFFSSDHAENAFDNRSDNKGPEPENLVVGKVRGRDYVFIGLERIGGVMVYDISDPFAPEFVQYINNRDFSADPETAAAGDLGPEGLIFIPRGHSPIRKPLLVVANEVSGTTTIYKIKRVR